MSIQIKIRQEVVPIACSPEHLKIVGKDSQEEFTSSWRDFLKLYPIYSFRYQPSVTEYYEMLTKDAANLSFVVCNQEMPLAICVLFTESVQDGDGVRRQGSYAGGGSLPIPLFHPKLGSKQVRFLEGFVFQEARRRLSEQQAKRWLIEADPLSVDTERLEDLVPSRSGALDISGQVHVMDLTLPEDEFWNQIRHSAKSTINQGLKKYEFKVYDQTNYTTEIGERHRLLHHKCSGRVTRPLPTFAKMYSWVQAGCGLMFEQLHEGQTVQMIFVTLGKETAYGASAADDPDFVPKVPLTHAMNYFIYEEVRKRGIKYYEVGDTSFRDTLFYMRTQKERKICEFKRSFGRQAMPAKRWIWFEDPRDEVQYLKDQVRRFEAFVTDYLNAKKDRPSAPA